MKRDGSIDGRGKRFMGEESKYGVMIHTYTCAFRPVLINGFKLQKRE
jgi:hypothetical protein